MQPVFALGFHVSAMEDVVCVTLWLALLNEVWQSGAHAPFCTAMSAMKSLGSFHQLEAHGTGRKSGRLFVDISLMERIVFTLPLITTQNTHRLRKQTRIRPTCSQTETSSRAALDVSTALKYCTC